MNATLDTKAFSSATYHLEGKQQHILERQVCLQQYKMHALHPFNPESAKFEIDKFPKITNGRKLKNKQHHSKVLPNSFPMNGNTSGLMSNLSVLNLALSGVNGLRPF